MAVHGVWRDEEAFGNLAVGWPFAHELCTGTSDLVGAAQPVVSAEPLSGVVGRRVRGLSDRVGALDEVLKVESPRGGATTVLAEIPCMA